MKKILLAMVAFVFCIASAQAETPQHSTDTAAFISQSLANNVSVADILVKLLKDGVNLQDAVGEVIKAGGGKQDVLKAAALINPNFSYNDPTLALSPTASGNEEDQKGDKHADANKKGSDSKHADAKKKTGGSEHPGVIALGGGGGASPF